LNSFYGRDGIYVSPCKISLKSVKPLLRHSNLSPFFQDGSYPLFWICGADFGLTQKEYLMILDDAKCGWNRFNRFDNTKV